MPHKVIALVFLVNAIAMVGATTADMSWIVGLKGGWEEAAITRAFQSVLDQHQGTLQFAWKMDEVTICQFDFPHSVDLEKVIQQFQQHHATVAVEKLDVDPLEAVLWIHHNHEISHHGLWDWFGGSENTNHPQTVLSWGLDRIDQPVSIVEPPLKQ